jgi:trimeric autotransporter adhesin
MNKLFSERIRALGTGIALLALVGLFLVSGFAEAKTKTTKIKNKDIANNAAINYSKLDLHGSIDSGDIQNGTILTEDLARDSVTSAKIKDGTILEEDIASGAITSDQILDGQVTADDLASDAITSAKIADDAITTGKILNSTISADDLATSSVTTVKILDDTIAAADIATDAVDSAEIKADAVTASEIATSGVATAEILNGTIINEDVGASAAIAYSKLNLSASILTGDIATDTILAGNIAADAIGSSEIAADAVGTSEIATNGVGSDEIAADAVTASEIATSGVATAEILNETIINEDISGSAAIAYSKLNLAGSIVTGDITNGTITGSDLANDITLAGDFTVSGGELYITPAASSASTTEGTIYYDGDDDNLYVYANGGWVDLTVGAAGALTLDDAYNASAGTSTVLVDAGNLTLRSNAASSLGDIIVDLNSTGDFLIKDAGVTYASFGDDQTITLGNNTGTVAINSSDWDITSEGAITGVSFDANGSGNSISNIESADITNGTIAAADLATDIAISTSGSVVTTGAGTITSAGAIAANGGITTNGGDDLGASGSRWSTIYADTLNFKDTLTDVTSNSVVTFGDSANTTITMGDSSTLDTLSIVANAAITDGQWSVSNAGAAAFASATVGGSNVVTVGDTGTVTSTMILDGTVAGGDLASNIAITTSGAASFTGSVSLGSGNNDTIGIDADTWDITSAGAATLVDLTATGNTTLGNGAADAIGLEGDITIGNGAGDDVTVNSNTWDVTKEGVASGLTGLTSTGNVDLTGATYVRVPKAASGETCDAGAKGSIYFDTDDNSFYGCNGTDWKKLDN